MDTISSIPPPALHVSPFPSHERQRGCCYLTGELIRPEEELVFIPIGERNVAPAKLKFLFVVLNMTITDNMDKKDEKKTMAERENFINNFFAIYEGEKVMLWRKLLRHRPDLFHVLLRFFSAPR